MKEVEPDNHIWHEDMGNKTVCIPHIGSYMYDLIGPPTPGFATSPLTATSTHMPSCDGVVVGMLTSSPQEEGMCRCGLLNNCSER